jgi:hypothetical protein
MKIAVYCLEWHTIGGSVHDLVAEPLQQHFGIELIPWDGDSIPDDKLDTNADVSLWFQFQPPDNALRLTKNHVWQPMWDNVRTFSPRRWRQIPKQLRVIAFSKAAADQARNAGLTTLELRYFKNPSVFTPAEWSGGRTALYWNRTGLVSPKFLRRFCDSLNIDALLFRPKLDPRWNPNAEYQLPATLGRTAVEVLPAVMERNAFWEQIERSNILIAPRLYEGAGMFFLESLARGSAVFAHDAPTMNEYIIHRTDGYLLKSTWNAARLFYSFKVRLWKKKLAPLPRYHFPIDHSKQDWAEITALDLEQLGTTALKRHHEGYTAWCASIPQYVEFLKAAVQ